MDFSQVEAIRKRRELTQTQLAESIGMSLFGYQKAVKINDTKVSTLEKIAGALGVDVRVFFQPTKVDVAELVAAEPPAPYTKPGRDPECDQAKLMAKHYKSMFESAQSANEALLGILDDIKEEQAHLNKMFTALQKTGTKGNNSGR